MLIGLGPHAKRIYINLFKKHNIIPKLIVDLNKKRDKVINYTKEMFTEPIKCYFIKDEDADLDDLSNYAKNDLKKLIKDLNIKYAIISTEPKSHFAYSKSLIDNTINILMDKPITSPINVLNNKLSSRKVEKEYKIFKNNKIIGIDLDDTITYTYDYMLKEAFKYDQEIGGNGIIDEKQYLIGDQFGWNEEQKRIFFKKHRINAIEKAKVRPYVKSILNKLIKLGYKIVIITARSSEYYDNPYEYTKKWLKKNNIPYNKLIVNCNNKKETCIKENIDVFLDDMPKNCNSVLEISNIDVYMMDNGNNNSSCKKVKDFKEFYKEVINHE